MKPTESWCATSPRERLSDGSSAGPWQFYNLIIVRTRTILVLLALVSLTLGASASTQEQAAGAQTIVVLPFENESHAPGLEWISEAFPEVLGSRMASPKLYVIGREDRLYAFDRSGIPTNVHLSRATLFRIAEQMDVDYVVLGRYSFDGQTFTGAAQTLDMKRLRLLPEMKETGSLPNLIEIQRNLAWELLKQLEPGFSTTRTDFLSAAPSVRLDAFENYIRGITAGTRQERVQRFRETLRLNPGYTPALLQLGKIYFADRQYELAASWFGKMPSADPLAREANFYLGLSAFYLADYARAENAFTFIAASLPLIEVYNNLGVVAGRRGKRAEIEYFQKAVEADPNDPDYHFNLAIALARAGDHTAAGRQLREALTLRPSDVEAKSLLDSIAGSHLVSSRLPAARIKLNYDETSFRQLALEIQNLTEARLAKTDPKTHAGYHIEHGSELLQQGFTAEAQAELEEAVGLDPTNPAGHLELARAFEKANAAARARIEAQAALRLQPSVDVYLLLARLDLQADDPQAAAKCIEQALALEPTNAKALELKTQVAAKLAGRPQ